MSRFIPRHAARRAPLLALTAALLAGTVAAAPPARPGDPYNTLGFRRAVTVTGIREHQAALQAIATASGGNRLAGTAGYDASAAYVIDKATAAGYQVTTQTFQFLLVADRTPPVLQRVSPNPVTFVDGVDFGTMSYSGSGDVTAPVWAVDIQQPPTSGSGTSGCEASDFAGFSPGSIALMQRGTCSFRIKADNALAAGAVASVIFNDARGGVIFGTLSPPATVVSQPVVGATTAVGDALRNGVTSGATGVVARVRTDTIAETRETVNVIAETPAGDPNNVIVVGAHLDSVSRGPGINDNGSGSATILEVAEQFAGQMRDTRNKLRFIWWGAEELGLIGSNYYVAQLSTAERAKIRMNLNFDMIGSPNFVRFIYDGNNSAFPVGTGVQAGPAGSGEIEHVFADYFASQGLGTEPTPFNGRSDYGPFITVGIPAGGLFTGAEGIKTAAQAAVYGGTAGQPYDPCYHLACDTYTNNSNTGLDQMSDAVAHAVIYWSKRNFVQSPLTEPASGPAMAGAATEGDGEDVHVEGVHDHAHDYVDR